jgi:hypothetical protein
MVCIAAAALAACTTRPPRQTRLMGETEMTVSASELRVQVRSLAGRFSGLMEEIGEEVLLSRETPEARRASLLWLTNGIPAMQQALFQPDPLAALLDGWFLIAQIRGYLERHRPTMEPEVYQRAIAMLDAMESDLRIILDNSGPKVDFERGRTFVYSKAADVLIDESFASRRGSTVFLSEFTARTGGGALQSIGSITETVEDLVARIDLNAEYIPKIARWQAMLFALDSGFDDVPQAVASLEYIELVAAEVERLAPVLENLPGLVTEERVAVLEALDASLVRTFRFVDSQRATLMHDDVRAEREAVLAALREERIAVLAAIADERRLVLEAVSTERAAAFDDLNQLMDEAFSRELDKFFIRALILIAIVLGGFAAITFLGVRALRESRRE